MLHLDSKKLQSGYAVAVLALLAFFFIWGIFAIATTQVLSVAYIQAIDKAKEGDALVMHNRDGTSGCIAIVQNTVTRSGIRDLRIGDLIGNCRLDSSRNLSNTEIARVIGESGVLKVVPREHVTGI